MTLSELNHNTEKNQLELKIDQVLSDKIRISSLKKNLEEETNTKTLQNQQLDT